MRYFRLVVLAFLSAVSMGAFAAPPVPMWYTNGAPYGYSSAAGACGAIPHSTVYTVEGSTQPTHCMTQDPATPGRVLYTQLYTMPDAICPSGGSPDKTKPYAQQCPDSAPVCEDKNPFVRKFIFPAGVAATPQPKSYYGCAVIVKQFLICRLETVAGVTSTYCMLEMVRTGLESGDESGPAATNVAQDNVSDPITSTPPLEAIGGECPLGTTKMGQTASGTPMCVGLGTNSSTSASTSTVTAPAVVTQNPDGSTTTAVTVTKTNADGSKTITTTNTAVAADGTKSVSQSASTSTTPTGQPGAEDNAQETNFCKQNPSLNVCKNSSVSGTCGQVACTGDAIQCATLRAAAAHECRTKEESDKIAQASSTGLGNAIIGGNDPAQAQINAALKGTEFDFSNPNLDASGFLGAGQCLAPMTFSVNGKVITQSFDSLCDKIQPLRLVILAMCSILAYLVVGRSILGS